MERTIAALSTPPAAAGLGVIRVSGEAAIEVTDRVFRAAARGKTLAGQPGYTALYGHVYDADGDIDECVALVFRAPHSYTGENVVELSCHGGTYLLGRVLSALFAAGAQPAQAGEFTRRAFVNGKIDLTQAEAVMELIAANGRLAAKTALAMREGTLHQRLDEIRQQLVQADASISAFVDYPYEDIPEPDLPGIRAALGEAAAALEKLLRTFDAGRVVREGIDTVIVGSPNVGKSTLMNCLSGCERSIVTPIAGTTRDIVEETVRLGDVLLRLADTAGIRETGDTVESIGVQRARDRLEQAALVLVLFDGSRPLGRDDLALIRETSGQAAVAVVNKADRPLEIDLSYIQSKYQHTVIVSAASGEGLDALEEAVRQITGVQALDEAEPLLATERQRDCTRRCLQNVREALDALGAGMTLDAVSVCVEAAVSAVLEMTGERVTETVVDDIFARFCVGK